MLHDPARHEALQLIDWDEARVRSTIEHIVRDTEARRLPSGDWPLHPRDAQGDLEPGLPFTNLYDGTCGVMWALHYLHAVGAAALINQDVFSPGSFDALLERNREGLQREAVAQATASFMMGDTPILLLALGQEPTLELADRLAALIAGNIDHPARELMWGSPGTLLAALFLRERTGEARWAALFRDTAAMLWSQLQWSAEHGCHYWVQDVFDRPTTYLDAVHGFVATASPLIRGRHLLEASAWEAWRACIVNTIERTATWEGGMANWRDLLDMPTGYNWKRLMQFCHGAPGFVICLADMPGTALDAVLIAAGEAIWAAGPLLKGSNLCHGTGGNGYAFLKLYQRTGDAQWLHRARAFAMHGIVQTEADAQRYGQRRYSLWTGDPGFAIYLWDCLRGAAAFPTLDVFYGSGIPTSGR